MLYYLSKYPDLQAAFGSDYKAALEHWLRVGMKEGHAASADFDVSYYLSTYADLQVAFGPTNYGAALRHWIQNGQKEGRKGVA